MAKLAEQLRQPSQTLYVTNLRAHVALLEGDFTSAERLINEALELGERAQSWNARIAYRLQLFLLREAQGRLAELSEIYEAIRAHSTTGRTDLRLRACEVLRRVRPP